MSACLPRCIEFGAGVRPGSASDTEGRDAQPKQQWSQHGEFPGAQGAVRELDAGAGIKFRPRLVLTSRVCSYWIGEEGDRA
jgi:hypothetical protein